MTGGGWPRRVVGRCELSVPYSKFRELRPATPFTTLPTDTYIRRPAECVPACAAQAVRVASSLLRLRPGRQSHAAGAISALLHDRGRHRAAATLTGFDATVVREGPSTGFRTSGCPI